MKVSLNKAQYRALNDLRGLPQGAHMMVMCSESTATGGVIEGDAQDFEELVAFISEGLADGAYRAGEGRVLMSLCVKINPDCADWLGM